jgi:hypothetical protein
MTTMSTNANHQYVTVTIDPHNIDPHTGMSRQQFLCLLELNRISLDESRMHEVNYYFNLWGDTLKQDNKMGKAHDFPAFIEWMKKQ